SEKVGAVKRASPGAMASARRKITSAAPLPQKISASSQPRRWAMAARNALQAGSGYCPTRPSASAAAARTLGGVPRGLQLTEKSRISPEYFVFAQIKSPPWGFTIQKASKLPEGAKGQRARAPRWP